MATPISGTTVACPLETQRSIPGLTLKLFVVHFVTQCFYFHCYHQREGRYLTPDALTFLIAPLNTLFRYAVALFGILGYLCCTLAYSISIVNPRHYRRQVLGTSRDALSALLGPKKSAGINRYLVLPGNAAEPATPAWSERVAGRVGPVIPVLAFITQYGGAIYLYYHCRQFNGVTLLDQQIFEQACGGLVIGVLSAGCTLKLRFFDEAIPDSRDSYLEHFVHFLRDQGDDEELYIGKLKQWRLFIHFARALSITFIIQMLLRDLNVEIGYLFLPLVGGICISFLYFALGTLLTTAAVRRAPLAERVRHAIRNLCISCCGMILGYVVLEFPLFGLVWQFRALVKLGVQASGLKNVALDEPCPLLRMDPVAEYIWWLG